MFFILYTHNFIRDDDDNYILIIDTPKKKNLTSSDLSKTQIVNGQRHLLERECAPSGLVSDFHSVGVLKTPVSTK